MIYADKTLQAITDAIMADGGARFRSFQGKVFPHMTDAYRAEEETVRQHLGASMIGKDCARAIWYSFRWVGKDPAPLDEPEKITAQARMYRLWNRGHLEEARIISLLLTIGAKVIQQRNGKQLRFQAADGHFAGSMDGIVVGLPEQAPGEQWLNEYKTVNDKRFKELQKKGVRVWDEVYYAQMQVYMREFKLRKCLFIAVNKNDDELYMEIVAYNEGVGEQYTHRAGVIIHNPEPPHRISRAGLGNMACKWCDFKRLCLPLNHEGPREVWLNCRTCIHSAPAHELNHDGEPYWICSRHGMGLDKSAQLAACQDYEVIDGL